MRPYDILGQGTERILMIPARDIHKYHFWQLSQTGERIAVKFKKVGSNLMAATVGQIAVYEKPNGHNFHYELMRNNSRILSGWGGVDHDQLLENMLEYVEII